MMPSTRLKRDENRQDGACRWALAGIESVQHSLEEGGEGGGEEALEGLAGWVRVRDRRQRGWGVSSGRSARGGKVCATSHPNSAKDGVLLRPGWRAFPAAKVIPQQGRTAGESGRTVGSSAGESVPFRQGGVSPPLAM